MLIDFCYEEVKILLSSKDRDRRLDSRGGYNFSITVYKILYSMSLDFNNFNVKKYKMLLNLDLKK